MTGQGRRLPPLPPVSFATAWLGHFPRPFKRGATGAEVDFDNSIVGNFIVDEDWFETNLFQLFTQLQNSEWFSTISVIIFEVNIAPEQKQAYWWIIFCFFHTFAFPSTLLVPCVTAVPAATCILFNSTNKLSISTDMVVDVHVTKKANKASHGKSQVFDIF